MPNAQSMNEARVPTTLRLLADETRWRLIAELRWSDWQVRELCARLGLPQNLVSYHLGLMREAGLVQSHRSDADGRALYYGLDISGLHAGLSGIHAALRLDTGAPASSHDAGPVLFVCTGNSARSQMAEGWLRHLSAGRIVARSAGTSPAALHLLAAQAMAEVGVDIGHQRSKALDAVADLAPTTVITVCDLAREECGTSPQAPLQLHWSIPDPAKASGTAAEQLDTFRAARDQLRARVQGLLALLPHATDRAATGA